MTLLLSHEITGAGDPAPCWDYNSEPVAGRLPGASADVTLLSTWPAALEGLRSRDLSAAGPECAAAGITLEGPGGLLRRRLPDLRAALNPVWSAQAAEQWRPAIRAAAEHRARCAAAAAKPAADLLAAFTRPLAIDVTCMTAGLSAIEQERIGALFATANGMITGPGDHARILAARNDLYDYLGPIAARKRRNGQGDLASQSAAALRPVPAQQALEGLGTIFGGFPSLEPVLAVLTYGALDQPEVMAACRARPALIPAAVREHLRHRAHHTFALPAPSTRPILVGNTLVPEGTVVLPVIRAAHRDPSHARDPAVFDLHRPRKAMLTFGAGYHACPGRALTMVVLEEAFRVLCELPVAAAPQPVTWLAGLMPVPERLSVIRKD
jgi:cytochrome P450